MKKIMLGMLLMILSAALIFGNVYHAVAVLKSTNVLVVLTPAMLGSWPNFASTHGGTLPTLDAAFASFVFTVLPGGFPNLPNVPPTYDTIVLVISSPADISGLTPAQKAMLNNFVFTGGKLIIYDSEATVAPASVDYSWLVYPFTTKNPGAMGYSSAAIVFVEDNTLGSTNAARLDHPLYYIDITTAPAGAWSDYVGDCNTFVTYDPHWCGDIKAENFYSDPQSGGYDGSAPSWTHAYAPYGGGLFIYNGFDIDPMTAALAPSTVGIGNCAKIWLMELNQPWGADYNLPCREPIAAPPVGGFWTPRASVVNAFELMSPWIAIAFIALATVALGARRFLVKHR